MQPKYQVSVACQPLRHRDWAYLWWDQGRETPAGDEAHFGEVLELVRMIYLDVEPGQVAIDFDSPFDQMANC